MNRTKKIKKTFKPSINSKLNIKSLSNRTPDDIELCNDLLKIKIGNNIKCLNYNNPKIITYFLSNLKYLKNLDVNNLIPPKQLYGNCWFNTMFVSFFFSDKGRLFFRFFRKLMITGKKYDDTPIFNTKLRELFFILNLYIEASYNRFNNKNKFSNNLKKLTNNLETNYIIKEIYNLINSNNENSNIPNINDAGNPIEYYISIMNYLNYNVLNILNIEIFKKYNIINLIKTYINKNNVYDVLFINDFESKSKYDLILDFQNYKYTLDSIIITNKDFFYQGSGRHFVSVLTINNNEYKFDGISKSRLIPFKWKNIINTDIDWQFDYEKKYNFRYGYKILLYYRIK